MDSVGSFMPGILEATRKLFEAPECPRFPHASVFTADCAEVLFALLEWLGLPLGPLWRIYFALSSRRWRVNWALATYEERMSVAMFSAVAMPMATIVADPKRFERFLRRVEEGDQEGRKVAG